MMVKAYSTGDLNRANRLATFYDSLCEESDTEFDQVAATAA